MSGNDDIACAEIDVYGRVQGVYFRAFTLKVASRLGLAGYAQNLPDGRVKVVAQGEKPLILELVDNLRIGPELSSVENIDINWIAPSDEITEFFIKR